MFASKSTLLICLLALCMAFVSAKPLSSITIEAASIKTNLSVVKPMAPSRSTSSRTAKSSSSKFSSSVSKSTVLPSKSEPSTIAKVTPAKISSIISNLPGLSVKPLSTEKAKSSSAKLSSSVSSTLRSTKSILSTTIKLASAKASVFKSTSASVIRPSFSSTSVPSALPTTTPSGFNLTELYYAQRAYSSSQSLYFHISDPATSNKTTHCIYDWAGYDSYPPGYWEHTAPWTSCEDKTFSFKVTHFENLIAWSYELKHQYMGHGTECISPTDPECTTTIGHANIRLIGDGDGSDGSDYNGCGASGNCGASKYGWVDGPIDSVCKGAACNGKVL